MPHSSRHCCHNVVAAVAAAATAVVAPRQMPRGTVGDANFNKAGELS